MMFYIFFNRAKFSWYGVVYGRNLRVYNKIYLLGSGTISIGSNFVFSSGGSINPINRNIRGAIFVATPKSKIQIGDRCGISSSCLWAENSITIGNDVNIGSDCLIMDNDAHPHDFMKRRVDYLTKVGWDKYSQEIPSLSVVIEDDVWIGARCIILKGVHIGARSIIAAGSVVTKNIPADCIAGGNPCRVIKTK